MRLIRPTWALSIRAVPAPCAVLRAAAAILLVLLASTAGSGLVTPVFADGSSGQTLLQALRDGAETGGAVYAGDCSGTRSPQDIGKVCSKLVEEHDGVRAYLAGRTFSEFRSWIFVQDGPDGWVVLATASLDTLAVPVAIPWPALGAGG